MSTTKQFSPGKSIWQTLCLHRPEFRAWAMYDWANSAVYTIIVTAVFPIFYAEYVASDLPKPQASQYFSFAKTISLVLAALITPFLGALADFSAKKKHFLAIFLGLGAGAIVGMFWLTQGQVFLASLLFVLAIFAVAGSLAFYDSFLPHLTAGDEMDRLSTSGFALGYLGGGVLLALVLLWIQFPEFFGFPGGDNLAPHEQSLPVRSSFLAVAIWWVVFSIPLFRKVPEPARVLEADESLADLSWSVAFTRLRETFSALQHYKQAFLFLLAFLFYNDGIVTIIGMATIYGVEIGLQAPDMIAAILLVQFLGVPFAFMFGHLASKLGAKRCIFLGLTVYIGICVFAFFMQSALEFWILAILVAMVQGGTQALSRSLFGSMIPKHKSAEFFSLFGVMEKFAGIFGPATFGLMIYLFGASKYAILSLIVFFILGAWILTKVDVAAGRKIVQ